MSKYSLIILSIVFVGIGCGDANQHQVDTFTSSKANSPAYQEGLALVAKSNCLSCHQINEQATGPAYVSIAKKYIDNPETIDQLSNKIINGSVGVWGQVPMNAHPNITKTDAEKMVSYILLLKEN